MKKNNIEIEITILGDCINLESNFIKLLDRGVTAEDFYTSQNQKVYNLLFDCYSKKGTTELLVLYNSTKEHDVLPSYLTELSESSIKNHDIDYLIDELFRLRATRERLKLADDIKNGILKSDDDIKKRLESIDIINSQIGSTSAITTLDKIKIVDVYKMEKIKTGFIDVDRRILGFVFGSLNIITGYNGNGKSTMINQMCIAQSLKQGYKVFAYSPELTNSNLKNWLYPTIASKDHFVEKDFYGNKYKSISDIGIRYIDEWIKDKLYIYSDTSITNNEKQLLSDMKYLAERKNVRVFIIDNLMKVDLEGSYKNEYVAQKIFVNKLKEFARQHNSIVHLVAHPRKPQEGKKSISKYDVSGSGDITNLADYVMSIARVSNEEREKAPHLKDSFIKVLKDRIKGNSEFGVDVFFDKDRRRFYTNDFELNADYGYTEGIEVVQVDMNKDAF